ncbi:MAG: phosphoglucosamine mutase [Planctomycetes bacterium]|nr:phosphoglucosamine mutase [Planctomycetota bacterium]
MSIFGTDGVRGRAGEGLLAADSVAKISSALASVLQERENFSSDVDSARGQAVYIGRDTRASGPDLLAQLSGGLLGAGFDVCDLGVLPTPGIAEVARSAGECCLAIVLSASHNPAEDNGIKLLSSSGAKVSDRFEDELSARFSEGGAPAEAGSSGVRDLSDEAFRLYAEYLVSCCPDGLDGLKVCIDAANGAASGIAAEVFLSLGAEVRAIGDQPDGRNINLGCGALYPGALAAEVRESGFDIGFCFDGDADRMIPVSGTGGIFDGDLVLALGGRHYQDEGKLPGKAVVGTVMSNIGLARSLEDAGISLIRTQVGDRNVFKEMVAGGHPVGGEQSGHIIFRDHSSTGDGILAAIKLLQFLQGYEMNLDRGAEIMTAYPQVLKNVRVRDKVELETVEPVREIVADVEQRLGAEGRVLLRYSGTEPLLRVMLEGPEQQLVDQLCDDICGVVEDSLGDR